MKVRIIASYPIEEKMEEKRKEVEASKNEVELIQF